VLWVLLLLSGLAAAAAVMARTDAILTHKLGEFAQAESTTDAALVNAIAMLSDEQTSRHPRIDGQPQTWEFRGIPVAVSISNEDGRIDLNTADDDLILAFLDSQGIPEDRATAMLGDLRKYQNVARGAAPPGTLRTLDELKKIASWNAQDVDCWRNSLTVYTGLPSVNSNDAPKQVEAALKWATDHRIGNRDWARASNTSAASLDQSLLGEVIRIVATASPTAGATTTREWIGRLTGDPHQTTLTMKWSRTTSASDLPCKNIVK
jgi:general secretion pathway protein K